MKSQVVKLFLCELFTINWIILTLLTTLVDKCVWAKVDNGTMLEVLSLPQGLLKGQMLMSRGKRVYYSFSSIPFARPPQMKFEPAEPGVHWDGMLDATKTAPMCPQVSRVRVGSTDIVGQEDCLYLSVHTPKEALVRGQRQRHNNNVELQYPVIFFIHDGMFTWGSGDEFGAKYFLDEDVILVTSNYRLGALGFLSTGDAEILGNVGLKDQNLALKWVQSNIEYFGGDPRRVTLFGSGSGAVSAQLHLLSAMSHGLFSHVIASSGSALVPWGISKNPGETARKFGTRLGCNSTNSRDLSLCLKAKDFKDIIRAQMTLTEWGNDPLVPFFPTVEIPTAPVVMMGLNSPGQINLGHHLYYRKPKESIFLHADPNKLILAGQFRRVPQLVGYQRNEVLLAQHAESILSNRKFVSEMNEEWYRIAPITLMYEEILTPYIAKQKEGVSEKIKSFYFGNKLIGSETRENLTNMYTDRYVIHGVELAAFNFARFSPVYPFELSFESNSRNFVSRGGVRGTFTSN